MKRDAQMYSNESEAQRYSLEYQAEGEQQIRILCYELMYLLKKY